MWKNRKWHLMTHICHGANDSYKEADHVWIGHLAVVPLGLRVVKEETVTGLDTNCLSVSDAESDWDIFLVLLHPLKPPVVL